MGKATRPAPTDRLGAGDMAIDDATYQRCVGAFTLVRRHLGINIKLHAADQEPEALLAQGDIFLFNHFARFETIIPGYLIYQATGVHCRTLASNELFAGSPAFTRFLTSIGAVPNKMEGVLAFLAAEILRGRKVVIFPEGGMIKNRKVTDENGELNILSPSTRRHRKHHTGAAALALVLEIFKKRIRTLSESGESDRLARWATALGIDEVERMVERALQSTSIVPANITFFPIRAGENILTRGASMLARGMAANLREELLVEGNILLKDTDMDIRLAAPLAPDIDWSWWERQLLAWSFSQIESLDHLFDINASPNKLIDRLASTLVHHNIRRLRDRCMAEMYRHTTVNLAHLASRLLMRLAVEGVSRLDHAAFRRLLYRTIKLAQAQPKLFLHRGLLDPEAYRGLLDGCCGDWDQLLATGRESGLLDLDEPELSLLPRLGEAATPEHPRLSHVLSVYANELEPLTPAVETINRAYDAGMQISPEELARFRLDDEQRSLRYVRRRYAKPRHAAINERETATGDARPYLIVPPNARPVGVLLVHGFLASPAELRPLGQTFAACGHAVMGCRLEGHGTSPWDLRDRSWLDWLDSVRRGYEILRGHVSSVCIVGFSTGGTLALRLAAERPEGLAGVAAVAAPVKLKSKGMAFIPAIHGVNRLSQWAWSLEGVWPFTPSNTEHPEINYRSIPVRGLFELKRAMDDCYRQLPSITCPVRLIQGRGDTIVDPRSATMIARRLKATEVETHWIDTDRHGLILEQVGPTWDLLVELVQNLSRPGAEALPVEERTVKALPWAEPHQA